MQLVAEASHEKRFAVAHALTRILQHEDGVLCDKDARIDMPNSPNPPVWITLRAHDHPEFGRGRLSAFWERARFEDSTGSGTRSAFFSSVIKYVWHWPLRILVGQQK